MNTRGLLKGIATLLSAVLLLSALVSCGTPQTDDESTDSVVETSATADSQAGSEEETDAGLRPSDGLFRIVENGVCNFKLIVSDNASDAENSILASVKNAIKTATDAEPALGTDWLYKEETYDPASFEILIGDTKCPQTQEVLNGTPYGAYRIAVADNKIVLAARSDAHLLKGAETLETMLVSAVEDGSMILPIEDIERVEIIDDTHSHVPVVPDIEYKHVYDANGATELIYKKATLEIFNAYVEKMTADGYTKYAQNETGLVHSAIFTDGENYTYNIVYEGGFDELDVIYEEYDEKKLPPKEQEYEKVCDTAFVQMGLEYQYTSTMTASQNGMCYIWRLEDGRFIILDGGFNYALGGQNLYNTLRQLAVDKNNIVIAAWAISHFHGDHVGALLAFTNDFGKKIKLESLLFNLPSLEESKSSNMTWSEWNKLELLIQKYYKDTVLYKAHPGQEYHFADAKLEILYTLEMNAPATLTSYNNCTVIIRASFGDFDMMMLGDCEEAANANLCGNYGAALESEVVQVAHHGYIGGSTPLYTHINPIYVFWPVGSTGYNNHAKNAEENPGDRNAYFFSKGTRIKRIFLAKSSVFVCTLEEDVGFTGGKRYENVNSFITNRGTEIVFQ